MFEAPRISLLFFVAAFLLGLEAYFRALDPQASFRWFSYDEGLNRWNRGEDDHYFLLSPSQTGRLNFNARRERSRQTFPYEKGAGKFRVLLLGSSLTIGWPDDHGVTEELAAKLKRSGKEPEVINCSLGNSNLATLLNTYVERCSRYQGVDALVITAPLIVFVDYLAANAFLWGENFIDDPNQLFYFLKHADLGELPLKRKDFGTPSLDLSPEEQKSLRDYYNQDGILYRHSHVVRAFMNAYRYSFLSDEKLIGGYKRYFDRTFKAIPPLAVTNEVLERFRLLAGARTKVILTLIPIYPSLALDERLRPRVLSKLKSLPAYSSHLSSPDHFALKNYQTLETYFGAYNDRLREFQTASKATGLTVIDLSGAFLAAPESFYTPDLYHLSAQGHEALAEKLFDVLSEASI